MARRIPTIWMGTACLVSALVLPAAPAAAGGPPPGSYQQTCIIYQVDDAKQEVWAVCGNGHGGRWGNPGWSYRYCVGDISNYYGSLRCTIDIARKEADTKAATDKAAAEYAAAQAAAQQAAAKAQTAAQLTGSEAAFAAAGVLVLGWMPNTSARLSFINQMKSPEFGMAAEAQDANIGMTAAAGFLKKLLQRPQSANLRAQATSLAYLNVYGRDATPAEAAAADATMAAGKSWYAPLVAQEQQRMRADAALRSGMIRQAYRDAMGRDPTAADRQYWSGRSDDYAHIVYAARQYLYAPAGAAERVETTRRALVALGKSTSDAAIKAAMIEYGPTRAIYAEMTAGAPLVLKLPGS